MAFLSIANWAWVKASNCQLAVVVAMEERQMTAAMVRR